jgi:hypothetical protein
VEVETSGTDGGKSSSPRLPMSRMSSEFGESQTYPRTFDDDVFSLVIAAGQDGVHVDINLSYTASVSPDMRCIPNMFAGSSSDAIRALFDEMPGAHKVFGEMSGVHSMFTDEEGADIMNEMIGGGHAGAGAQMLTPVKMISRRPLRLWTPTPASFMAT